MTTANREHYQFWWQALLALPPTRSSIAYQRLSRIFRDQTRPTMATGAERKRGHEFTNPTCETHLTVALWENFVMLPPAAWMSLLWKESGLGTALGLVKRCNWSYQWAEHGKPKARHCDLVLEYEDGRGRGILVVEAKRPGNTLSEKDLDPGYYLGIPKLAGFSRRSLIYLVDDAARIGDAHRVRAGAHDVGFLSWVQLANLQLDAVQHLQASDEVRAFVAASLYNLFGARGILPTLLPLTYLQGEPSTDDVLDGQAGAPLGEADWPRLIWQIPAGEPAA